MKMRVFVCPRGLEATGRERNVWLSRDGPADSLPDLQGLKSLSYRHILRMTCAHHGAGLSSATLTLEIGAPEMQANPPM